VEIRRLLISKVSEPRSFLSPYFVLTSFLLIDKDKWIEVERRRWARLFSIPMREAPPPDFPPLTLTIMRALCALTLLHPGKEGQGPLTKALDELYREFWVNHKKTNEKDVLAKVLEKVLGKEETEKGMFPSLYLRVVSFWTR